MDKDVSFIGDIVGEDGVILFDIDVFYSKETEKCIRQARMM